MTPEERSAAIIAAYFEPPEYPVESDLYNKVTASISAAIKAALAEERIKVAERDRDWVLAMGHALGLDSGFDVPIVPEVEPFKRLFKAIRERG